MARTGRSPPARCRHRATAGAQSVEARGVGPTCYGMLRFRVFRKRSPGLGLLTQIISQYVFTPDFSLILMGSGTKRQVILMCLLGSDSRPNCIVKQELRGTIHVADSRRKCLLDPGSPRFPPAGQQIIDDAEVPPKFWPGGRGRANDATRVLAPVKSGLHLSTTGSTDERFGLNGKFRSLTQPGLFATMNACQRNGGDGHA